MKPLCREETVWVAGTPQDMKTQAGKNKDVVVTDHLYGLRMYCEVRAG